MALIKCPECELQVSDKALSCPHCGFPLKNPNTKSIKNRNSSRRKRLPNGFGSIVKLSKQNLRKPYMARKTVGKTEFGKPILKPIGYFETYNEAYEALVEYNKNPYDIDAEGILFCEAYEQWSNEYYETIAPSSTRSLIAAYAYCSPIYNMRFKDLRIHHLKGCINDAQVGQTTKERMKSLFNLMYDWALEHEIVATNYARNFSVKSVIIQENTTQKKPKVPFSKEEIKTLWKNVDKVEFVDMILVGIYSGWRPQELAILQHKDIDLENGWMTGGMKTESGKDRMVPIHPKVFFLIENRYNKNHDFLFCDEKSRDPKMTYDKYKKRFAKVMDRLNMKHTPHEARHTFITIAKESKMDEYAIKKIVGHAISDITEAIYTHRDQEWLKEEIEKIK